jgi:hypothetical protein
MGDGNDSGHTSLRNPGYKSVRSPREAFMGRLPPPTRERATFVDEGVS